jgi:pimeloyl-ACP methyl ester carboxylesterase
MHCKEAMKMSALPVVLLHSSASSSAQWRPLLERLSPPCRVIAPDLCGYGASAHWPGERRFDLAQEAQAIYSFLDTLGEPVHLVGHSYGGAVALHIARRRGELLRSLTVYEPVAFHLLRGQDAQALAEISEIAAAVAASLACGDYAGGCARFVDYWSGPGSWAGMPQAKRDAMVPRLAKVALDFHATLSEPAGIEDFGALGLPTLVLQGGRSPLPTRRICELLAGVVPECRLRTVDAAGHMGPLTHRDVINDLIVAHLNSSDPTLVKEPSCKNAMPSASKFRNAFAGTSTAT